MNDIDLAWLKDELEEWQGSYEHPADRKQHAFFTALIGAIEELEVAQRDRDDLIKNHRNHAARLIDEQYAERDAMELDEAGGYYCRHVSAMTGEHLHSKGDIAAELGHRDMLIDQLTARAEAAEEELKRRDAQEPDGHIFCHPNGKLFWSVSDDSNAGRNGVRPFYFAAPAAVLPSK